MLSHIPIDLNLHLNHISPLSLKLLFALNYICSNVVRELPLYFDVCMWYFAVLRIPNVLHSDTEHLSLVNQVVVFVLSCFPLVSQCLL